jgi:hypothetical protein
LYFANKEGAIRVPVAAREVFLINARREIICLSLIGGVFEFTLFMNSCRVYGLRPVIMLTLFSLSYSQDPNK